MVVYLTRLYNMRTELSPYGIDFISFDANFSFP